MKNKWIAQNRPEGSHEIDETTSEVGKPDEEEFQFVPKSDNPYLEVQCKPVLPKKPLVNLEDCGSTSVEFDEVFNKAVEILERQKSELI